jgi:hypothetical protein
MVKKSIKTNTYKISRDCGQQQGQIIGFGPVHPEHPVNPVK